MRLIIQILLILFIVGCGRYEKTPVDIQNIKDKKTAQIYALAHAYSINGSVYEVSPTGSMEPTLKSGDLVVVSSPEQDKFENIKEGDILVYQAQWLPAEDLLVIHRAIQKDKYGWIMSGDNSTVSESKTRVTQKEYKGKLVKVYRTVPE